MIKKSNKTIDKICPECNTEFTIYQSETTQCCSKDCSWKWKYKQKHPFAAQGLKKCNKCEEIKDLEKFPKLKVSVDGRRGKCNSCWDIQYPYTGQTDAEKRKTKDTFLKSKYDIDLAEYERMYNLQKGKCYICQKESNLALAVDHCHTNGKVRKLLCSKCNMGLGHFNDNIDLLKSAIAYLKEH